MFGENKKLINNYLTSLLKKDSKALVKIFNYKE
jgi:hypothetical protein